jgi:hypothetical protein
LDRLEKGSAAFNLAKELGDDDTHKIKKILECIEMLISKNPRYAEAGRTWNQEKDGIMDDLNEIIEELAGQPNNQELSKFFMLQMDILPEPKYEIRGYRPHCCPRSII